MFWLWVTLVAWVGATVGVFAMGVVAGARMWEAREEAYDAGENNGLWESDKRAEKAYQDGYRIGLAAGKRVGKPLTATIGDRVRTKREG